MNNFLSLALQPSSSSSGGPNGCRFKGVVPQQNGHWGAQIYAKHQRVWLGTFKTERDAAMAYDSAAIKLRSSDSYRNLSLSPDHLALEKNFQSHFSVEPLLAMIKDGTYQTKLGEFSRAWQSKSDRQASLLNSHYPGGTMRVGVGGVEEIVYKDYFEKELTPSDVGKLNRLVIPKKYAVKFFPQVTEAARSGGEIPDADLEFFDRTMRQWTFRYCYWKSSQSFVFTKGWNKFVKENRIKTKDVIVFYNCEMKPRLGVHHDTTTFTMIDYRQCRGEADGAGPSGTVDGDEEDDKPEINQDKAEENAADVQPHRRTFRLFGMDIM